MVWSVAGSAASTNYVVYSAGDASYAEIKIYSVPNDAEVTLINSGKVYYGESEVKGVTPFRTQVRSLNPYKIKISKPFYYDYYSDDIIVEGQKTKEIFVDLLPLPSELNITSFPSGANIYIDESFEGITPKKIYIFSPLDDNFKDKLNDEETYKRYSELNLGSHIIRLSKTGYSPYSTTAIISLGEKTDLTADLSQISDVIKNTTTISKNSTNTPTLLPQPLSVSAKQNATLIWNYTTGDSVNSIAISADGQYVAAGSADNTIYYFSRDGNALWNYTTGDSVNSIRDFSRWSVCCRRVCG